jgi:adenylate cyclase
LLGIAGETKEPPRLREFLGLYSDGLRLYRERKWDEAIGKFREALGANPGDYPASMYIARSEAFRETPPPPGWKGEFVMEKK